MQQRDAVGVVPHPAGYLSQVEGPGSLARSSARRLPRKYQAGSAVSLVTAGRGLGMYKHTQARSWDGRWQGPSGRPKKQFAE